MYVVDKLRYKDVAPHATFSHQRSKLRNDDLGQFKPDIGPFHSPENMTRFRPCIDLHAGQVKQIVGGTLDSSNAGKLQTNFVSEQPAAHYAQLYKDNDLDGAHVIMLGPGNEEAAKQAIGAWPNGLQVGGGINEKNAAEWIAAGAEKVRGD